MSIEFVRTFLVSIRGICEQIVQKHGPRVDEGRSVRRMEKSCPVTAPLRWPPLCCSLMTFAGRRHPRGGASRKSIFVREPRRISRNFYGNIDVENPVSYRSKSFETLDRSAWIVPINPLLYVLSLDNACHNQHDTRTLHPQNQFYVETYMSHL